MTSRKLVVRRPSKHPASVGSSGTGSPRLSTRSSVSAASGSPAHTASPGAAPLSLDDVSGGGAAGFSGGGSAGTAVAANDYSLPGVLDFLQREFRRFERERGKWDAERAELQARVSHLEGERRGMENLKEDLVRRVKMLEYALRQERKKFLNAKENGGAGAGDAASAANSGMTRQPSDLSLNSLSTSGTSSAAHDWNTLKLSRPAVAGNITLRGRSPRSRQILKQYLDDMDNSLSNSLGASGRSPMGSKSVGPASSHSGAFIRSMLASSASAKDGRKYPALHDSLFVPDAGAGSQAGSAPQPSSSAAAAAAAGAAATMPAAATAPSSPPPVPEEVRTSADAKPAPSAAIQPSGGTGESDEDLMKMAQAELGISSDKLEKMFNMYGGAKGKGKRKSKNAAMGALAAAMAAGEAGDAAGNAAPAAVPAGDAAASPPAAAQALSSRGVARGRKGRQALAAAAAAASASGDAGELDELASLSIGVVKKDSPDSAASRAGQRSWKPKHTLKRHFDGVRSVVFHPTAAALFSASEDFTVKVWNIKNMLAPTTSRRSADRAELDPVFTFRGHTAPVFAVAVNETGSQCFTAGQDASVMAWNVPALDDQPNGAYGRAAHNLAASLQGHTDAVWSLAAHPLQPLLLSGSADASVRLWSTQFDGAVSSEARRVMELRTPDTARAHIPTSVGFVTSDLHRCITAYTSPLLGVWDVETGSLVSSLGLPSEDSLTMPSSDAVLSSSPSPTTQTNAIACHPTLSLVVTAHEDRRMRFFDLNSGKCVHSMIAHLDAVSCLAMDAAGLYLVSGGHDSSLRFWDVSQRLIIQELSVHRRKHDEAVYSVACHPTIPVVASGGADSCVKLYQ